MVRENDVPDAAQWNRVMSRFADAQKNGYQYPQTPSGETIIVTGSKSMQNDAIVFVKGTIENPIVTKVYTLVSNVDDISVSDIIGDGDTL